MEEEIIYINPDCPVYISYAWDKNGEDLEFDVNKLCDLMNANGIFFKRDKGEGKTAQSHIGITSMKQKKKSARAT